MKSRVTLEPELEEIAAMWPVAKRFEIARKLKRWSRQLRISALILAADAPDRMLRPRGRRKIIRKKC